MAMMCQHSNHFFGVDQSGQRFQGYEIYLEQVPHIQQAAS